MPPNWRLPTANDVEDFMSTVVVERATQSATQIENILDGVVARIRGTISAAGTPLSSQDNSVPPEALQHALVLTVFVLVTTNPMLQFVTKDEYDKLVKMAEDWIAYVQRGGSTTYPSDPVEDVSENTRVRWTSDDKVVTTAA